MDIEVRRHPIIFRLKRAELEQTVNAANHVYKEGGRLFLVMVYRKTDMFGLL